MKNYVVEKTFEHKGLACAVVMTAMGHRCGYVGVPEYHMLFETRFTAADVNVHGGLSYSDGDPDYPIESKLWWFGFDCAHGYDKRDFETAEKLFKDNPEALNILENIRQANFENDLGKLWTLEDVEEECKQLAEQLALVEKLAKV